MITAADKIKLIESKLDYFNSLLTKCGLCPRECKVNRFNQYGFCKQKSEEITVYTAFLHKGEEPVISGLNGSGTIFFSGCNLQCVFCQNYKFSHQISGTKLSVNELSHIMVKLQDRGAHNINLVTPTHILPQILKSLVIALKKGLLIPIVYNTSGYEKPKIIASLSGIIDIYLTDIKYFSPQTAAKYSYTFDYPKFNQESLKEMVNQSEPPSFEGQLIKRGVIVRHLIIPGLSSETIRILNWLCNNLSDKKFFVSVMSQFQPYFKSRLHPVLNNSLNKSEYAKIKKFLEESSLEGWIQDFIPSEHLAGKYFKPSLKELLG
ncbi:MAG: radical SAM protein [Candidatus Omnitrophota bacterium]